MHGNGNITGTLLANVEIECSDCHGTATYYPWELPLGWGDEFGSKPDMNNARGLANEPLANHRAFSTQYEMKDGYLLTTRGNHFNNVVRDGDKVLVHSASGLDFEVPTLKSLALTEKWKNPAKAISAKIQAKKTHGNPRMLRLPFSLGASMLWVPCKSRFLWGQEGDGLGCGR
jgi:hypothetical protein